MFGVLREWSYLSATYQYRRQTITWCTKSLIGASQYWARSHANAEYSLCGAMNICTHLNLNTRTLASTAAGVARTNARACTHLLTRTPTQTTAPVALHASNCDSHCMQATETATACKQLWRPLHASNCDSNCDSHVSNCDSPYPAQAAHASLNTPACAGTRLNASNSACTRWHSRDHWCILCCLPVTHAPRTAACPAPCKRLPAVWRDSVFQSATGWARHVAPVRPIPTSSLQPHPLSGRWRAARLPRGR